MHVRFADRTLIRRREDGDIWTGLYEFPMIETDVETGLDDLSRTPDWQTFFDGQTPVVKAASPVVTHRLTHRILKIRFYEISVIRPVRGKNIIEISANDIHRYAVPKVIDNYLTRYTI